MRMWACPDDLLDVYAELRPPVAASHVYNNDDLRSLTHTLTHSHTYTLSHTHTLKHSHTHSSTHTHTHSHTTHTLCHTLKSLLPCDTNSFTDTVILSCRLTHSFIHSLTHSLTYKHVLPSTITLPLFLPPLYHTATHTSFTHFMESYIHSLIYPLTHLSRTHSCHAQCLRSSH